MREQKFHVLMGALNLTCVIIIRTGHLNFALTPETYFGTGCNHNSLSLAIICSIFLPNRVVALSLTCSLTAKKHDIQNCNLRWRKISYSTRMVRVRYNYARPWWKVLQLLPKGTGTVPRLLHIYCIHHQYCQQQSLL